MVTEQTTTPADLKSLLKTINDQTEIIRELTARNKALETRKEFLENILNERIKVTVRKRYNELKHYFDDVRGKALHIFLENPELSATHGYTHREFVDEFHKRYPAISVENIPRRVRELVQQKKLWVTSEPKRGIVFRLKLEKSEEKE